MPARAERINGDGARSTPGGEGWLIGGVINRIVLAQATTGTVG